MLEVAYGMEYLHTLEPAVIHGDLRAVCCTNMQMHFKNLIID